jgi:hypothetical protein
MNKGVGLLSLLLAIGFSQKKISKSLALVFCFENFNFGKVRKKSSYCSSYGTDGKNCLERVQKVQKTKITFFLRSCFASLRYHCIAYPWPVYGATSLTDRYFLSALSASRRKQKRGHLHIRGKNTSVQDK